MTLSSSGRWTRFCTLLGAFMKKQLHTACHAYHWQMLLSRTQLSSTSRGEWMQVSPVFTTLSSGTQIFSRGHQTSESMSSWCTNSQTFKPCPTQPSLLQLGKMPWFAKTSQQIKVKLLQPQSSIAWMCSVQYRMDVLSPVLHGCAMGVPSISERFGNQASPISVACRRCAAGPHFTTFKRGRREGILPDPAEQNRCP